MRRPRGDAFERPWLILCEGESDKRFLDRLIAVRNIGNQFHVRFPDRGDGSGGRSKFGYELDLLYRTVPTFRETIKAVLIVSDNDEDPNASWNEVKEQLARSGGFGVPETERVVARATGFPDAVALMVPTGEPGNLETLCLQAAYDKWPIRTALDAYVAGTPANEWRLGKQSKMRLQSLLAATCESRPDSGFAGHWREREDFHVPLDHACFNDLADFLFGFGALLDAATVESKTSAGAPRRERRPPHKR